MRELLKHRGGVVGCVEELPDRANDRGLLSALRVAEGEAVQAVLADERVAHAGIPLEESDAADAPVT